MIDLTFPTLYALRDKLERLAFNVARAQRQREEVLRAPPHFDEVVEAYQLGVEAVARDHEERLAAFALDPLLADITAVVGPETPIYFMRDLIASKLPAIVERVCPDAKKGIKLADRRQALQESAAVLQGLYDERESVRRELAMEQATMRNQKQEAIWQNDWRSRTAIEGEYDTLLKELMALTGEQEKLRRAMTSPFG